MNVHICVKPFLKFGSVPVVVLYYTHAPTQSGLTLFVKKYWA